MAHKNHPGLSSGRTVKARDLHYIQRPADAELLDHCKNGRPAYILNSPQMGKSSLISHTAEQLNATAHHAVLIDLSQFPLPSREAEWFHNIVRILDDSLDLTTDLMSWWEKPAVFALPPYRRLTRLITEVILPEITGPLVLFIDEIERTAPLPFREHFFEWLTTLYESRATDSILYRFSFVICGVATPSQLIPDGGSLLFQWSHRVVLSDFTIEEALVLAGGLSLPTNTGQETVEWVYRWTNGHPYLTQLLCQVLEEQHRTAWYEAEVDECIRHFIVSPQALREPHFQFVRTSLTEPDINGISLLEPYLDLLDNKIDSLKTNQAAMDRLRLVGVLREDGDEIALRNELYREVFSPEWVKLHLRPPTTVTPSPALQPIPTHPPAPKSSYIMAASIFLLGVGLLVWFFSPLVSPPLAVTTQKAASVSKDPPSVPSLAMEVAQTPQQSDALTHAQEKNQELEATIARYQQISADETHGFVEQRTQLETQLASKEHAFSELQIHVHTLTSELTDQQDAHEQAIATLHAENATIQFQATTTAGELATALEEVTTLQVAVLKKSSISPSEIKKLMAARSELGTQLKTANTELALAHERARNFDSLLSQHKQLLQVENQQRTADQKRLGSTIKELEASLADTRHILLTQEGTAREHADLARSELNRLQQDRTKYKELLSASQEELSTLNTQAVQIEAAFAQKNEANREELSSLRNTAVRLNAAFAQKNEASQEALSSLKAQAVKLESTLAQKNQGIQEAQQEHAQLTTELQDLRSQESQSASRLNQLQTLLAKKSGNAESTVTSLQQERDRLTAELNQVKRELNSATTQVAGLGTQLSTALGQVAFSKNSLQAIHTSSSEQTQRTEEQLTKLALARSTLQTRLRESQTALTQSQKHIQSLEKSLRTVSSTAKDSGRSESRASTSLKSLRTNSLPQKDMVKMISRITGKLTQAPSLKESDTTRLLWSRQAFLFSLRNGGPELASIDRSLREGLRSSPIQLKGASGRIHTLTFDPTGDHVIAGTSHGKMFMWSMKRPLDSPQVFTGHTAGVLSVVVSPNGQHIASGSLDSTIRLWDLSEATAPPRILQAHTKGTTSVAFKPNGKQLASGSQDHTIRLWDVTSKHPRATILGSHAGRVNAIGYTPDGKTLLSGGDDLTLKVWDLQRRESPPRILRGHQHSISTIAIHPSGWIVATGSRDRQIGLWNLRQSLVSPTFLTGSTGRISQVQFSSDGTSLASVSSDKSLRIWNWHEPNEPPIQFPGHKGTLKAMTISPDGRTIAVGGSSHIVTLWSSTGQLAHAVCDTAKENLSYTEWKHIAGEEIPYERTCPNLPLHPTFLAEGKTLARQGARKEAQKIFERAKQLDPYLEFDTEKELKKLSAKLS